MKYLIYGAGTIGITYAWLLSQKHEVDILVKAGRSEEISKGFSMNVKDLRKKSIEYESMIFSPHCIKEFDAQYDGVLVCVNRYELKDVLFELSKYQYSTKWFAFLQNHWNIQSEIDAFLPEDKTVIAFPSSVGGGRTNNGVEVIIFDEATRLGGECQIGIDDLRESLNQVGIKTYYDKEIYNWLKVHYLQQSITAGAVLESGGFLPFAQDYNAVKKMVKAFREGIEVCRLQGVPTNKIFPANMFKLPLFLVARTMQKMFLDRNTVEMVNNHMKKGLPEWVVGYKEVLQDGIKAGIPMSVWKSYDSSVEEYLRGSRSIPFAEE